jgi:putative ABC transport system ATP-binding protein
MSDLVVKTNKLTRMFGDVAALSDIDMTVKRGEWLSIMGPSGCGKTTFLNIISLLDSPTGGSYLLDGVETATLSEKERLQVRREQIGLIFQQFHLVPYLTALENVMLAQYYHSMVAPKEAEETLARVGLSHRLDHLPSMLSGGEQQRVCIARALINEPAIIMADEPTGNLDEENERVVVDIFKSLHDEGKTLIMVTHNPEMGEHGDRIMRLHFGKLLEAEIA